MLTRAAARQKEIAIRTALGAGRLRLVRQMLTESGLLAVMGGGVGVLFALWIIDLLPQLKAVNIPRIEQIGIDGRVLAATLGLSLLTGVITGSIPALRSSKLNLSQSLNEPVRAVLRGRPSLAWMIPSRERRGGPGGPPVQDSLSLLSEVRHRQLDLLRWSTAARLFYNRREKLAVTEVFAMHMGVKPWSDSEAAVAKVRSATQR